MKKSLLFATALLFGASLDMLARSGTSYIYINNKTDQTITVESWGWDRVGVKPMNDVSAKTYTIEPGKQKSVFSLKRSTDLGNITSGMEAEITLRFGNKVKINAGQSTQGLNWNINSRDYNTDAIQKKMWGYFIDMDTKSATLGFDDIVVTISPAS